MHKSLLIIVAIAATVQGRRRCMRLGIEGVNIVDLTHTHNSKSFNHPNFNPPFKLTNIPIDNPDYYVSANRFSTPEHSGTHMDAPAHFYADKNTMEKVPLKSVMGRGYVIDLVKEDGTLVDNDYQITVKDITDWEAKYEQIRRNTILLFRTGYGQYYPDQMEKYLGTTNITDASTYHFPGLSQEAAQFLATKRKLRAVGMDVPSPDFGQTRQNWSHRILLEKDIIILENVANMEALVSRPFSFHILALPMKIEGGTGAPARVVAVMDDFGVP